MISRNWCFHYHSKAHEVLGVFGGYAIVQLGGEKGSGKSDGATIGELYFNDLFSDIFRMHPENR